MKLNLVRVTFIDPETDGVSSWVEMKMAIAIPLGKSADGEINVSVDMDRESFEKSTIKELAALGEQKATQAIALAK